MSVASKGLGKGLSALMAEDYSQEPSVEGQAGQSIHQLDIKDLTSGKYQPRHHFDEAALKDLADSIRSNGVMQPIIARRLETPRNNAAYEIIAGERRWRASKIAGLDQVPVIVRDIEDKKALELALIENVQRQDLNALEESEGYQQLIDGFGYKQEELSKVVGKSRSHISNSLRLLGLPREITQLLREGELTAGHARALLQSDKPIELAQEVIRRGLNVRQTENLAKNGGLPVKEVVSNPEIPPRKAEAKKATSTVGAQDKEKDPDILALEETLLEHLGMHVDIDDRGEKGAVVIHYESLAQLDTILKRLGSVT